MVQKPIVFARNPQLSHWTVATVLLMVAGHLWAANSKPAKPAPRNSASAMSSNATSATVALPRAVSHGDRQSPMVALTFDDAPHPEYVPRLLALFRAENVKATFFLVGSQVKLFPDVARAIVADGHEIGNHSLSHRQLPRGSASVAEEEIVGMQQLLKERLGISPILYRPTFGVASNEVKRICEREHLAVILWDVDTNDWRDGSTRETIVRTALQNVTSGSIILFHATHLRSIEAVAELIPLLRVRGYELVTVSKLLEDRAQREEIRRLSPKKEPSPVARRKPQTDDQPLSSADDYTTPIIQTPILPTP